MHRGNAGNTGVIKTSALQSEATEAWKFRTESWVRSSPAMKENTLVFSSLNGILYAVSVDSGDLKWRFKSPSRIGSSPVISGNRVYTGSFDGRLYALDLQTGKQV